MNDHPLKQGKLTENPAGLGTVTRSMVKTRALELAVIDERSALEVTQSDWEQAKRELTGQTEMDPNTIVLEAAPESERWDPVPGSSGHKVPAAPGADEDEEGRSDHERLVDEGLAEATLDQMNQPARAAV